MIVLLHHVALLQGAARLAISRVDMNVFIQTGRENQRLVRTGDVLDRPNNVGVSCELGDLNDLRFIHDWVPRANSLGIVFSECGPTAQVFLGALGFADLLFHFD